jgi:hypothetical protein
VINSNTSDFATGYITGVGSLTLSVKDNTNDYTAGDYAGFVISSGLFSLGLFQSIQIKTYLNGTLKETYQAVDLVGLSSGFLSGPIHIGFTTTMNFDQVEIHIDNLLGLGSYHIYYAELESFCAGDPLDCNVQTRMNSPAYPMTVDYGLTGTTGASVVIIDNPSDAISSSTTDYASFIQIATLVGSANLAVEDQSTDYPVGTYVGFDIENTTLLGVGVLNFITITSYLNDVQQQSVTGPALLAGVPLLSTSGRYTIGFVTNTMVDKVRITLAQPAGVTLGTTRIYGAIFQAFCEGDDPGCNVNTILTQPDYPVLIDMNQTGLTGAACGGCNIYDPGNVIDASSSTYSLITITAGVATVGSIAVKDQLTDYPVGTFVGFRIENPTLVGANALSGITVSTYLNGAFQQSQTNAGTLVSVNTDLLVNDDQQLVGFVTTMPFDEVKISLYNVAGVDVGTTKVHEMVITTFCPTPIACDTTYYLNAPGFPAYVDAFRTGIFGGACVACAVTNEQNVITTSNSDYGLITVVAGAVGFGSIAVADALYTYPQGTYAGFVIEDLGLLLEAQLFAKLTITTYNNGVFQESKSGSDLIDLAVIILFISDAPGRYNVGFKTSLPFDEVRISVGSLATVVNLIRVYGAFVDTRASNGGTLFCNDAPTANKDIASCPEDSNVNIDVLLNDVDSDDPLGVPSVTTSPSHGTVMVNADSTITYTPNPNYFGPDNFIYTLCDPHAVCDTAIVVINVTPVNDRPLANADNASTPEDTPTTITVLSNDSDVDSPLANPAVTTPPAHGMTTVNPDGTITYTPNPNYNGPDSFIYTICDPQPLCDTAIVHINVSAVNDGPLANTDSASTPEDTPTTINVLVNDSDVDSPLGTPSVTTPATHGMTTVNGDGTITYTPNAGYNGPDSFIYTICDAQPLCDTAIVYINVSSINNPPVANADNATTPEDTPTTIAVLANDSDVDSPLNNPTVTTPPLHGMTTVNGDGSITYTPNGNYNGPDSFIYQICDAQSLCDTAIVHINVTPVNDAPLAVVDNASTPEDTPTTITVLANDSDVDSPLNNPTVTTPPLHGMTTVNAGGTITYTPNPNYNGPDSFIYQICDAQPLCDTAIVHINVTPVNDGPLANTDNVSTPEDNPTIISVLTNDTDPDNAVGPPTVTTPPTHGMTTVNPDGTITYTPNPNYNGPDSFIYQICDAQPLCDTAIVHINVGAVNDPPLAVVDNASTPEDTPTTITVLANDSDVDSPLNNPTVTTPPLHGMTTVNAGGTITYTPNPNYNGPDSFIYQICDAQSLCDTAIVHINVTPINDAPLAVVDNASTPEDMPTTITVLANDSDVDSPLNNPTVTTPPLHGMTTVNAGGTITYTPNPNYNGPDSFIYQICDAQPLCDTAIVHINVGAVNDPPLAVVDNASTPEDMPTTITVLANDSDVDSPLNNPTVTTPPLHGMTTVNAGGTITYTPNPNYNGPDSFIYQICDAQSLCDTAIVHINVTPVNDAPLAVVDNASTPEDMPTTITVLANDSDVDSPLNNPTVTTPPLHGMTTVNAGGTITYTPNPNYNGPDSFIYQICDAQPLCDTAIVHINVTPVNDAPLAVVDNASTPEDMATTITVLANDSDVDSPLNNPTVTTPPLHGMTTVNAGGTITYTPNPNYNGPDSFIYQICDAQPLCDTAIVHINVTPVNDAPLAVVDNASTPEDMPTTITVLANDSDVDSPLNNPTVTTPPLHGMTTVNAGGTITYTPNPNYNGPDSFIYQICDAQALCDTAIVHINVTAVNDAPLANTDYASTPQDMPTTITVLVNDSDVDNALGTPTVTTPPSHGTTMVNGSGTITYTPTAGYTGPDSFIYTLCDPQPLCDTALVHINVTPMGVPVDQLPGEPGDGMWFSKLCSANQYLDCIGQYNRRLWWQCKHHDQLQWIKCSAFELQFVNRIGHNIHSNGSMWYFSNLCAQCLSR